MRHRTKPPIHVPSLHGQTGSRDAARARWRRRDRLHDRRARPGDRDDDAEHPRPPVPRPAPSPGGAGTHRVLQRRARRAAAAHPPDAGGRLQPRGDPPRPQLRPDGDRAAGRRLRERAPRRLGGGAGRGRHSRRARPPLRHHRPRPRPPLRADRPPPRPRRRARRDPQPAPPARRRAARPSRAAAAGVHRGRRGRQPPRPRGRPPLRPPSTSRKGAAAVRGGGASRRRLAADAGRAGADAPARPRQPRRGRSRRWPRWAWSTAPTSRSSAAAPRVRTPPPRAAGCSRSRGDRRLLSVNIGAVAPLTADGAPWRAGSSSPRSRGGCGSRG